MLVTIIVACEVGFWVFIAAGLIARYPLRRPRLGAVLLICAPVVDLILLGATAIDLSRGAPAEVAHGLAAAYIGFSVAFGHGMIRWADERFAHRFGGGPAPVRPPHYGAERTRREWREFGKAALAWAISCALLVVAILIVGDAARTGELEAWIVRLSVVLAIWSLFPIGYTIWPASPRPSV